MGRLGIRHFKRIIASGAVISALVIATVGSIGTGTAQQNDVRDCDDNAIMRCGALSVTELKDKYNDDQAGNTQAIFREFGINSQAALNGMAEGRVTAQNEVFVGDQKVATHAMTAGRQPINRRGGTSTPIAGGAAYKRAPSVSFSDANGSLRALVKMENGTFKYAVITACGNPVTARPVVTTPPPPPVEEKKPDFEVSKQVRKDGSFRWSENISAKRGDHIEYRVTIRNTGDVVLENVMLRDSLPNGIGYVGDSLRIGNRQSDTNPTGAAINIGEIGVRRSVSVRYKAVIGNNAEACGTDRLRNVARVQPQGLTEKEDDASVEVCVPQVQAKVTPTPPPSAKFVPADVQPTPKELPKTGSVSGAVGALFIAFTAGGALARQVYVTYRAKGTLF